MHVCEYAVLPAHGKVVGQRAVTRDLPAPVPARSIYERIGGHEPIEATLLRFHNKGFNHPQVQKWFEDVPDTIGYGQLRSFMIIGFGGPNVEEALILKDAYESTVDDELSGEDFEIMLDIFAESMKEVEVETEVATAVIKNLRSILDDIASC